MLTFAFCTYKRSGRLARLVAAMRAQQCLEPFEILAVNNNSPDDTLHVLERLARLPGAPLRYVTETEQGIVPARNRALAEAMGSDILVFIDDDELPLSGLLLAAANAVRSEGARCAGGRVSVDFSSLSRPPWLGHELLGFLAEVQHGSTPLWITDESTPIWTANVAYDMSLFRDDPSLRFDSRYNRRGSVAGGGEDVMMFRALLARGVPIRYRPDMAVLHAVEPWRLRRRYFLNIHYRAGLQYGRFELAEYPRCVLGVPPFLVGQLLRQCLKTVAIAARGRGGVLRQAMNVAHAWGVIVGCAQRAARV